MSNNNQIIYEGARIIRCDLGKEIIIGEGSYIRDSKICDNVQINRRNIFEDVVVGDYSYTGANTIIKHAHIGKYCSISWNVSATGNLHEYKGISSHPFINLKSFRYVEKNTPLDFERISIGNDVWIGANVCVLAGIKIGNGAVIGAGSVVTKDIPPYAIAVGNPAKILKYRFDHEIIELLLDSEWWDWPHNIIKENINLFSCEMSIDTARKLSRIKEHQIDG